MANHNNTKKSVRQTEVRTARNRSRMTRIRNEIKKVNEAITTGDKAAAGTAFNTMQSQLMRGVSKNLFHANTVSRKLSRLSAKIKAI